MELLESTAGGKAVKNGFTAIKEWGRKQISNLEVKQGFTADSLDSEQREAESPKEHSAVNARLNLQQW